MDIIPSTAPKSLTSDTTFSNYLFIVYAYSNITLCQISSMNKKARSKIPLKPKAPFKWFFYGYNSINSTKTFANDTTFSNYLLIADAYSKIPKLYGMENIPTT